tara:strand:+ start:77 stop:877 length:801 start_codon:yes stop_codon:yes gene_type:complete
MFDSINYKLFKMKNIYFLLIALFVTTGSYSQYRVFHFIGSEKGKKNIVKQALLKDLKESSEVRIKNGDLKGLDIWHTISGAGDGYTDFVVVELYDDLTNYHKNRSLGKNLKWNPDESKKFSENWNSASSDNNYRIILKVEAFASKTKELPKIARFNMYQTVDNKMRNKWIEGHKKFSNQYIKGKRDAWGSGSVIMKPFHVKYNQITVDFYDNQNLASFLLDNESGSGMSDEMRKYWKKDDGTMPNMNKEVRAQVNRLMTKNILQLR